MKNQDALDIDDSDIIEAERQEETRNNILAIQNNYFTDHIDLVALANLAKNNQKLAEDYMDLQKSQFEHVKKLENEIIEIEKTEQSSRIDDTQYDRKYASKAQVISFIIVILGLSASIVLGMLKLEAASIAAITIPIGVVAVNFLGIKNKGQK